MKTIIFDMYGVIAKDPHGALMPFLWRTFPHLIEEEVYALWSKANTGELTSAQLLAGLGFTDDLDAIEKAYLDTIEIDEDFFAAAKALRRTYRLALLSNDVAQWSAALRAKHGLDQWFDDVVISGDVALQKPDPAIFTLLLRRLNACAGDCIFIDDRRHNLDSAQLMGMTPIRFDRSRSISDRTCVCSFQELLRILLP